jgi:hypothetical protein
MAQHYAGHRRRQADGNHPLDKGPPRQSAGLYIRNQVSKFPLIHRTRSSLALNAQFTLRYPCRAQAQKRLERDQVSSALSKQDPGQRRFRLPVARRDSAAGSGLFPRMGTGIVDLIVFVPDADPKELDAPARYAILVANGRLFADNGMQGADQIEPKSKAWSVA